MVAGYTNGVADATKIGHRNVDMRSDTVTQPTPGMREAMANAEVGTHCSGRGEEVLCGKDSHIFFYEQGGSSSLMGVVYNTFPNKPDGTLDLEEVAKYIRPDNDHFSSAKLLALENTQNKLGGLVLPVGYMEKAGEFCKAHGLRLHVDGARLWNAAVALGLPPAELVRPADSVNVCLSKGLGAPVGSVLVGTAEFIQKARRLRKAVGGGLRQVGILAAAGLYALEHNLARLKEDHENASRLAQGLKDLGLNVLPAPTNLVFFDVDRPRGGESIGRQRDSHALPRR